MSSTDLAVSGGTGGTEARLDDLEAVGGLLLRVATRVAALAAGAGSAAGPGLSATAPLSPLTFLAAEQALLSATAMLAAAGVRLAGLGAAACAAAAAYRATEATVTAAQRAAEHQLARAAGTVAGWLGGPILALALPASLAVPRPGPPAPAGAECVPAGPPGPEVAAGALAARLLAARPGLVEHLVDATPSGLAGLVRSGSTPIAGSTGFGTALLGAETTALIAVLGPPTDVPGTAAAVARAGRLSPLLHEPGVVRARPIGPPRPGRAPGGVAEVLAGLQQVSTDSDECAPGLLRSTPQARIRVQRLDPPGGRRAWIVSVPGTRTWSPVAGTNPLDLTGNLRAMGQQRTAAGSAVLAAMRRSGVRPGEPVLLAGHSQGGLVAADLAADPAVRREFAITHVVTAGSPIALDPIPAGVEVLALEHDDVVPRLDGAPNPAGPNWVTVTRAASGDPALPAAGPMPNHGLAGYVRTAGLVDASGDPSLVAWRQGAAAFLAGPGDPARSQDFDAERVLR